MSSHSLHPHRHAARSRGHQTSNLPGLLSILLLFFAAIAIQAENIEPGQEQKALTPDLKPGDYIWQPEVSPAGPVAIIVSLSEQTLYVYRNGVRIGRSTVSSGKTGHKTPTGVFTILEKNVVHHSSAYHEASMPYMERITWGGVAIHAGNLPGYPESHGCIHVPMDFAKKLYDITDKGTTVLVTDAKATPSSPAQPGLLFSANPGGGPPSTPADRAAAIGGADGGRSYGNHVYAALAERTPEGGHQWETLGSLDGSPPPDVPELRKRLGIPPDFLAQVRGVVTPGTTLVITDRPVNDTTRSGPGFSVLDAGEQPAQ